MLATVEKESGFKLQGQGYEGDPTNATGSWPPLSFPEPSLHRAEYAARPITLPNILARRHPSQLGQLVKIVHLTLCCSADEA